MTLTQDSKDTIRGTLSQQFSDGTKNVNFQYYVSSKDLSQSSVDSLLEDNFDHDISVSRINAQGFSFWHKDEPVYFLEESMERWLIIYSSDLDNDLRNYLSSLDRKKGWIIPSWVPGDILTQIYHDYCPDDENVNIERKWDPYWIYQRGSDIPEELQDYYEENLDQFVEQEIKFNLRTPKGLVDDALHAGVKDKLLDKSELSETRFEMRMPRSERTLSDGGALADNSPSDSQVDTAQVSVELDGEIVQHSGDPEAVFFLLNELENRNKIFDFLDQVTGNREYRNYDSGISRLTSFEPSKVLKLVFYEKDYDEEASIKLSNILTVGQDDVELHGMIKKRDGLGFLAESYTVFDGSECDVLFTGSENRPAIYIKPSSTSTAGLVYIYWKLTQKFDPRVEKSIHDEFPSPRWI